MREMELGGFVRRRLSEKSRLKTIAASAVGEEVTGQVPPFEAKLGVRAMVTREGKNVAELRQGETVAHGRGSGLRPQGSQEIHEAEPPSAAAPGSAELRVERVHRRLRFAVSRKFGAPAADRVADDCPCRADRNCERRQLRPRQRETQGPPETLFINHRDEQPAQGETYRQPTDRRDDGEGKALGTGAQREFMPRKPQGSQSGELLAPVEEHARQRQRQPDYRDKNSNNFKRVSNRKGLVKNTQDLAAQVGVGENGESGISLH